MKCNNFFTNTTIMHLLLTNLSSFIQSSVKRVYFVFLHKTTSLLRADDLNVDIFSVYMKQFVIFNEMFLMPDVVFFFSLKRSILRYTFIRHVSLFHSDLFSFIWRSWKYNYFGQTFFFIQQKSECVLSFSHSHFLCCLSWKDLARFHSLLQEKKLSNIRVTYTLNSP